MLLLIAYICHVILCVVSIIQVVVLVVSVVIVVVVRVGALIFCVAVAYHSEMHHLQRIAALCLAEIASSCL